MVMVITYGNNSYSFRIKNMSQKQVSFSKIELNKRVGKNYEKYFSFHYECKFLIQIIYIRMPFLKLFFGGNS